MSDENPMGQVIQIDEARIRDHLGEMVRGTVAARLGRIPGLAAMNEHCRPALARSTLRFRSCGARLSRRPSSSATAGGRARSRKR